MDKNDKPSTSGTPAATTEQFAPAGCVLHKVTKLDTLAGLAIKFGVSVSDIKRANGLLSENGIYAREYLIIPTKGLPVGEQVQSMLAQVLSGVGRDPTLDAEANHHPASASVARIARQFKMVSGKSYPEDVPADCPWFCQCGTSDGDGDENRVAPPRRRSSSSFGELEMTEFSERMAETLFIPPATAGTTRLHEQMRRRRNGNESPGSEDGEGAPHHQSYYDKTDKSQRASQPSTSSAPNGRHNPAAPGDDESRAIKDFFTWKHLSKTIGESEIVKRLQQIANSPALATPSHSSFAEAAEGVLQSRKAAGPGTPGVAAPGQRASSMVSSSSGANLAAARHKDSSKQE